MSSNAAQMAAASKETKKPASLTGAANIQAGAPAALIVRLAQSIGCIQSFTRAIYANREQKTRCYRITYRQTQEGQLSTFCARKTSPRAKILHPTIHAAFVFIKEKTT
jgi:hypothetical protein